jgi:hypothetical protein
MVVYQSIVVYLDKYLLHKMYQNKLLDYLNEEIFSNYHLEIYHDQQKPKHFQHHVVIMLGHIQEVYHLIVLNHQQLYNDNLLDYLKISNRYS